MMEKAERVRAVAGEGAVVSREGASGASCASASAIAPSDVPAFSPMSRRSRCACFSHMRA